MSEEQHKHYIELLEKQNRTFRTQNRGFRRVMFAMACTIAGLGALLVACVWVCGGPVSG